MLFALVFSTATAFGYGLLGDFSDLLFGFWGTAIFILLPLFGLLAILLMRAAPLARKNGSPRSSCCSASFIHASLDWIATANRFI